MKSLLQKILRRARYLWKLASVHFNRKRLAYKIARILQRMQLAEWAAYGDLQTVRFESLLPAKLYKLTPKLSPQLFFENPREEIQGMQKKAARTLMRLIGADFLPKRLQWLLGRYDAFQAIQRFLAAMNLRYSLILKRKKQRRLFATFLDIIAEVDTLLEGATTLNDIPIYSALHTHDEDIIEEAVARLRTARELEAEIYNLSSTNRIVFPGFLNEFVTPALEFLEHWDTVDKEVAETIREELDKWQALQVRYDGVTMRIDSLISYLHDNMAPDSRFKKAFKGIVAEAKRLRMAAEDGIDEPAEAIEALEELYKELEILFQKACDENSNRGYKPPPPPEKTDEEKAMNILGVHPSEGLNLEAIRKQYHILCKKYHPDRNPGKDTTQKMQEINEAYNFLARKIRAGG